MRWPDRTDRSSYVNPLAYCLFTVTRAMLTCSVRVITWGASGVLSIVCPLTWAKDTDSRP